MPRDNCQQTLPRLNEMRAWIAEAKRPQVVVAPQPALAAPPAPTSIADELGGLAGLRDQGVSSDAEFQNAKQRVLAQHGMARLSEKEPGWPRRRRRGSSSDR